jgi:hypothetical protein
MLDKPTEIGSLFRVAGLERETHVYRFAGTLFVYVGPGPEADEPDPA